MQAVILSGGKGFRLDATGQLLPKPLAQLAGLTLLDHVLAWLGQQGVNDVVLCTGHRAEQVREAVGGGERLGLRVRHSEEAQPVGSAGAVRAAAALLRERFLVIHGDVLADVDVGDMLRAHLQAGALATLAVQTSDRPMERDRVVTDRHGSVLRWARKEDGAGPEAGGLCLAGLYVCERAVLDLIPADRPSDFTRDVFPAALRAGHALRTWRTAEYVRDVGTPARLGAVEADLREGVPARMRRSAARAGVLIDRDGVLLEEVPYLSRRDDLKLMPGAAAALARINRAHALSVVCTNQPVVARGGITEEDLHGLHQLMEGTLGAEGAFLDGILVCPHHPDKGFPGERADLKVHCGCRKPLPGLIHRAEAELGLHRPSSVMLGDRSTDLWAARRAGVLGIGILTGLRCKDGKLPIPPETPLVTNLGEAVSLVLDTAPSWDPFLEDIRRARVVLLGGPSRVGKTLCAAALALRLRGQGVPVTHLSLDRFIQPHAARRPSSTLKERLSFASSAEAVARLVGGQAVLLPGYEPLTRETCPSSVAQWDGRGVLVVEGILAMAVEVPGAFQVAMQERVDVLRERRRDFYAWKGLSEPEAQAAVDGRGEEHEVVAREVERAPLRLRLDGGMRLAAGE
jgi:histidinol-phosphate phosphatase family protein